ncbi:hypothetical protein CEXT_114591 [Caerostris extrusa]|uniref:Uncharacterized protein n=1 Tax=Caerostris extrusa TaxID=172846 RepID=A0AAV4X5J1_CAEEX|nr:hypothetical protein CEXT_114591 [Caerostris extrusa]
MAELSKMSTRPANRPGRKRSRFPPCISEAQAEKAARLARDRAYLKNSESRECKSSPCTARGDGGFEQKWQGSVCSHHLTRVRAGSLSRDFTQFKVAGLATPVPFIWADKGTSRPPEYSDHTESLVICKW